MAASSGAAFSIMLLLLGSGMGCGVDFLEFGD